MSNVDGYLMRTNRARQRRRRFIIATTAVTGVCLLTIGAAWTVIVSPLLAVQTVTVAGTVNVPAENIRSLAIGLAARDSFVGRFLGAGNMLAWTAGAARDMLRFLPAVKDVAFGKRYVAHEVTLSVTERQPFGIWCLHGTRINADNKQMNADGMPSADGVQATDTISTGADAVPYTETAVEESARCFWFDEDGVIFERAPDAEGSVIRIVHDYSQEHLGPGSTILPARFVPNLFSIFRVLAASGVGVAEVRLDDLDLEEIRVATYDGLPAGQVGPTLYFSLRFPADNALAVMRSLTGGSSSSIAAGLHKLEYIDFRVENRAYYK